MSGEPVTGGEPGQPQDRTPPARDPLLGRVLGAYRIQEHVGEGTGLPSYLAEHVHLDRKVLFKLFHPPRGPGESEAIRRAIQQARELSALRHEGVLPLVEIAECGDGFMYVVLELSGARPLPALLAERGPLPWPLARTLGRQIAAGLMAAEAASLASTEPTASQIFVTGTDSGEPRARVDLVTPEALGWVPARSPDQTRAVGRLLYAMLAGHEPAGMHDQDALPLPDLVLGAPEHDVPADADALVMRAVDPERARRWPDLATLHRELGGRDAASRDHATKERATAEPNPMASTMRLMGGDENDEHGDVSFGRRLFARPSRPALIAGAVGILAALIVGLAIVSGPSDSDTAASRATAEKFKLAPIPPPQPMALPPPPVPAPEPEEQPSGSDAAVVPDGAVAAASPEGAAPAAEVAPSNEAAAGAVAPAPAAAAPVAAAVIDRGTPSPPTGALAPGAPAPAAPRALAATAPGKATAAPAPRPPAPVSATAPSVAALTAAPPAGPSAGTAAAPAATPTKEGAGAACTVSLGSIPWSDVQVDGQRAGFTPLTDFPVACGTHEILFTSPDRGLERKITLSVRPGEKVKRIVDLGGPKGATTAGPGVAAPARPPCRLTLGSKPWSEVWIDGNRAGTTPLVDYPVTCGTHDVLFLSRETNVQHRESLTVQSTLKRVITLVDSSD